MFSWIWRHLPFGLAGRIIGSLVLTGGLAAVLWYGVFPNVEQYMPFTDGQVTTDTGGEPGADTIDPSLGPDDIPYSTASNDAPPSPTKTR